MGVSFKIARAGTRYRPKLGQIDERDHGNGSLANDSQQRSKEANVTGVGQKDAGHTDYLANSELHLEDFQVSFSLNLFANGFSAGKAAEIFNDVPMKLHPYDRASETLFTAIEYGWLPGNVFDDIPCNYINGVLLCEIRDYRNCPSQRPSTVNSPVTHRVLLQMCMENVVKDILLLSDDSWSYEDLLEVESHILKALQPDLNLNPMPLLKKYPGKPLIKKFGNLLGLEEEKPKRGPVPPTTTTGGSQSQNSNCQSGLGYPDRRVPYSQQAVSVSVQTLPENSITCSQSDPSIVSFPSVNSSNRSFGKSPISSAITSIQKQYLGSHESDMREASSLVAAETCRSEIEATQRPVMKIPKQEPLDLSQDQYLGSQAEGIDSGYFYQHWVPWIPAKSSLTFELQWKNNISYQNTGSEKDQHAVPYKEGYPCLSIKGCQQAVFEGILILQDEIPASIVKQKPIFEFLRTKDQSFMMGMRNDQYNLQSSPLVTANTSSTNSLETGIMHPVRNLRDETVDQKRKALQKEASAPAKQRKNSCSKGLSVGILDTLAGTTNVSAANARNISWVSVHLHPNSEVYGNSLLQRFVKIEGVTQSKPYSSVFPLTALKLEEDGENGNQKPIAEGIPLSKCFIDKRQNVSKSRISIYVHLPHIHHGVKNPNIDTEHRIKMLMSEKLNERMVEGKLLYGQDKEIDFALLLTFPNTHFADLFASQFTSLMTHEGYCLVTDRVVPNPVNVIHSSSSQQPTVTVSGATQIAGRTLELSSLTLTYGSSPTMRTALTGTMSAGPGGNLFPTVCSQSTFQLPGGTISKLTLDAAAQVSPGLPLWQEILNKRAHLHFLMKQRERPQQQLMQQKLMVGRLGVSMSGLGTIQLGGGSQRLGNVGIVPRAPTFSDMAFVLNNQQPPQPLTHQQQILNQHQMRGPHQSLAPASLTEYASSHLTKAGLQQIGQQPRLNHDSASQLTNRENMASGPHSPELSSQSHGHGSVSGGKGTSSRNFTERVYSIESIQFQLEGKEIKFLCSIGGRIQVAKVV